MICASYILNYTFIFILISKNNYYTNFDLVVLTLIKSLIWATKMA